MKSSDLKKTAIWGLAILTVINLAILATISYHIIFRKPHVNYDAERMKIEQAPFFECRGKCDFETQIRYSRFKTDYKYESKPVLDSLRELRFEMMDELQKKNPDTLLLAHLADVSGKYYSELRKITIKHFLKMRDSFPPELRMRFLNSCGRGEEGIRNANLCGKRERNCMDTRNIQQHRRGCCPKH